jgi:protein phosphatase PTC1
MEDDEIIVDKFCGNEKQGFFGLYDGHGGRGTVDFVVKTLHVNLQEHIKKNPNQPWAVAFKEAYLATDGQLRRQNILRSGSTSVTCVISVNEQGKRVLFTANVGDSRAILCRGGKAIRLTIDHKASLPEEAKRIQDAGGFIGRNKRVNGVLAISRALGDHMLKENDVVTAIPYCLDTELTEDDTFLILACDGLWDVMSDQEAVDFLIAHIAKLTTGGASEGESKEKTESKESNSNAMDTSSGNSSKPKSLNELLTSCARALVKEALDRKSLDNVTCMCIKL